jgi:hypothetical protein
LGELDFQDKNETVKDFRHYIFAIINRTARLANSLPQIQMDFEKEIARIMAHAVRRRTEKIVG